MINLIERTASSLAGIGISTTFGSQLVSSIDIIVIPSFLHSAMAVASRFGSTTIAISGTCDISVNPPKFCISFSLSRRKRAASFFGNESNSPLSSLLFNSLRYSTRPRTVDQFVRVPPSQRWLI